MYSERNEPQSDYRALLQKALEAGARPALAGLLEALHPAEIADALEALPRDQRADLWQEVDVIAKGEVLLEAHREVRRQLIDATEEAELLAFVQPGCG